jgi:tRNA pseudouridine38-40 synthase
LDRFGGNPGSVPPRPASRVRLVLEYDGTEFSGWAAQPGQRTVEAELARALELAIGTPSKLTAAGRTDAGVHAWGQVVSFDTEADESRLAGLTRSLNGLLPPDVAVVSTSVVENGFDARRDARSRTYCYRVLSRSAPSPFERGRSLWWPRPIEEQVLDACAAALPGKHDFTAFTPTQSDHVRFEREVMLAEWRRAGEVLEFWIEADTFMRHMVRVLVGTMLEVAVHQRTVAEFARLLEGAPRLAAGATAEPHGLYLASVRY